MAATGGAELQRADGAETAGAAAGATDGAAQAAALSDLSHAGKTGPPRAPHAAAAGSQLEPVFQLAVRPSRAAFARALLKPGVENHFRLVPPHDGDPSRPCCLENGPSLAARPLPAPWPTLLPARSRVRLLPPPATVASHLLRTDYGTLRRVSSSAKLICHETKPEFCQRQQRGGASRGAGGDTARQPGACGGVWG